MTIIDSEGVRVWKALFFSRYLYISIVFFSYIICATEFLLLNIIQKYLRRFCMREQETAWKPEVICPCCLWTAFLHDGPGLSQSCEKVHCNIYWSNLDYVREHSQSRVRMSTLFSDPACFPHLNKAILWGSCRRRFVSWSETRWSCKDNAELFLEVTFSCCENVNVRCLPAFDSRDAH